MNSSPPSLRETLLAASLATVFATTAGFGLALAGRVDAGVAVAAGAVLGMLNIVAWMLAVRGMLVGGLARAWLVAKAGVGLFAVWAITALPTPAPAIAGFLVPLFGLTLHCLWAARQLARPA
jgi:hypothetical protein